MKSNPIICAIDTTDVSKAVALAESLKNNVGAIKLGLEFFTANGAAGVGKIAALGIPIFLDLKFHDIPNTVAGAVRAASVMNPFMMTVHASGGEVMMRAAKEAAQNLPNKPLIIGVTVLTSMDEGDIASIGINGKVSDQVKRLAALAQKSGLDGVVCSPHEIEILRAECGKLFKLVVPGIRPAGSNNDDQKRTMTPREATQKGADYLVIGRPITGAENPIEAAKNILVDLGILEN